MEARAMLAITMPVRTKPAEKEAFGNTDFWIKLKLITATLMALALTKLKVTRRAVKAGVLNDDIRSVISVFQK